MGTTDGTGGSGTMTGRARGALVAAGRGLALALVSLAGSITLFVLAVVSIALVPLGAGLLTTPYVLRLVRAHARQRRLLAARWAGVRVPAVYRPLPEDLGHGPAGQARRTLRLLRDPATWRDLQWLLVDMTGGFVLAVLAPGLVAQGVFGLLLSAGLWRPVVRADGTYWYAFVPVSDATTAAFAAALGVVWLAVALFAGRHLVRAHFTVTRALLAPGLDTELERRIDRLTATRHDAVDASAAELRRIERDLHDGAQARLVAVGMDLSTVEALVDRDPAQAKELLARARRSSAEALTELRDLVRGIHPPVLAERGLADAVRALALRLPLEVEVRCDPAGRAGAPVESAAYFAVSEALANAVKHAGASRVDVDLRHEDGMLRITVADDGRGGAVVGGGGGTGLSGVERRLGTFDGVLAVSSPPGGPTLVTLELPCAWS
ncbi:sensor domain-containing protein [Streptomyces sp. NPDC001941]|uniref:sensor histidine kinase n=1 Tax=Streptomyces sp. NPDC001941 TaxID=3154659 RepID=UPI003320491E